MARKNADKGRERAEQAHTDVVADKWALVAVDEAASSRSLPWWRAWWRALWRGGRRRRARHLELKQLVVTAQTPGVSVTATFEDTTREHQRTRAAVASAETLREILAHLRVQTDLAAAAAHSAAASAEIAAEQAHMVREILTLLREWQGITPEHEKEILALLQISTCSETLQPSAD